MALSGVTRGTSTSTSFHKSHVVVLFIAVDEKTFLEKTNKQTKSSIPLIHVSGEAVFDAARALSLIPV